jgi:ferredoxin
VIYHLYYFSGTGNTWRAVGRIADVLSSAGHKVQAVSINRWCEPLPEEPDRLLVAFPTLAFAPPALVIRFLRRLPRRRVRAAVFATNGGSGFDVPLRAARILRRRGYDVFLTGAASYSENWVQVLSGPGPEKKKRDTVRGDGMTDAFAQRLVADESHHDLGNGLTLLLSRGIGPLFGLVGRRFLGKMFVADRDCTSCGLCKTHCPVGAIVMGAGRNAQPYWKLNCESCNRCVNICPTGAINSSIVRSIVLLALVLLACIFGLAAYFRLMAPHVARFAGALAPAVNTVAVVLIVALGHWIPLGAFDRLLIRPLQRLPVMNRIFEWSFSKKFMRYRMDGYKPPVEHVRTTDLKESERSPRGRR